MLRFHTLAAAHEPPLVPANPERWAEDRQYIRNDANHLDQLDRALRGEA